MKLFLTGATGFVGSHVLAQALRDGHQVVALRRHGSQPKIALPASPHWLERPLDELTTADLEGCDALIHLAAVGVSPQVASWPELIRWNVGATARLLPEACKAGIRRCVIAGTFAEYGRSADRYDPIPADAPLLPTYPYAASKAASFAVAMAQAVELGLELAYLRIFSAFGEGQFDGNFWPALRNAALTGQDFPMTPGEQVRDYVPIEHVAAAFLKAAQRPDIAVGQPWVRNLGSGQPVSMRRFAEDWWQRWNATGRLRPGALPYRDNEVMRFVPAMQGDE